MSDYKRLTRRFINSQMQQDVQLNETVSNGIFRLAELEDLIEQGTLVQLDENLIGEEVIGIHKCTDGRYYLDLDENIVIGFTSNSVVTWNNSHGFNDCFENGYYFPNTEKGRAEAEARLEQLKRGDK